MFTEQASEYFGYFNLAVWAIIFVTVIYKFSRSIRLVPTQSAYLVERLGKYRATLGPGIHLLLPFFDQVTFIQDLKEESIGVDPQECFTSDNVKVEVDGVIYLSVTDPVNSSYGVTDYRFAATQLAQTTTRSMIGTLDLDRTFEERDIISAKVVEVLSEVGQGWGITVHRYEIKNIVPPSSVREAMERQVTAERERRAIVARSEGDKQSRINRSEGLKEELVNRSEGEMQRRINEAEGKAADIEALSEATAESFDLLAAAIRQKVGKEAVRLQVRQ
ncbi:MAG: paraslipin, partial [SAR324 cluster bacterium]|nr:paraslipin [SAR324 cluster bacterium]